MNAIATATLERRLSIERTILRHLRSAPDAVEFRHLAYAMGYDYRGAGPARKRLDPPELAAILDDMVGSGELARVELMVPDVAYGHRDHDRPVPYRAAIAYEPTKGGGR